MNLSAAVIAGGHSRRMGSDKALLPHPEHGTLLRRQLHVLASLEPSEVLISCRAGQVLPIPKTARRIHDSGTLGPLAGLAALLAAARGELLLVLGVDLGQITPEFLKQLVAAVPSSLACGVVPETARGFEPLAAIYPTELALEARRRIEAAEDLSLQGFVRAAITAGQLTALKLTPADEALLANWNTPEDIPARADGA